jgi:hypothetical protein
MVLKEIQPKTELKESPIDFSLMKELEKRLGQKS